MVDCSHANSSKKPELQPLVVENVANQIIEGNHSIVGLMIESNLKAGNQSIPDNLDELEYGVSVTDGCIDWETTEQCLRDMREKLTIGTAAAVRALEARPGGSSPLNSKPATCRVIGHVTHALELRQLLQQGFFHASLERLVDSAAPLATSAKLQHRVLNRR